MGEPDPDRIEQAWRDAIDDDVSRALAAGADYPTAVHAIIKAEAQRRGISADSCVFSTAPAPSIIQRLGAVALRFVWAHRIIAALAFGASVSLGLRSVLAILGIKDFRVWLVVFLVVYLVGLCLVCWPLRVYRVIPCTALAAWAGDLLVGILRVGKYFFKMTALDLFAGLLISLLTLWLVPCILLSGGVFLHNRYWPVFPAGHCKNCGYNLRGLPIPRCPECGEAFDPTEALADEKGVA